MKHFAECSNGQGCWFRRLLEADNYIPVCISLCPLDGAVMGVFMLQARLGKESTWGAHTIKP